MKQETKSSGTEKCVFSIFVFASNEMEEKKNTGEWNVNWKRSVKWNVAYEYLYESHFKLTRLAKGSQWIHEVTYQINTNHFQ